MERKSFGTNEGGYTLVEVVLVIVITGVISILLTGPLIEGGKVWDQIQRRKDMTQQSRLALDRMTRELSSTRRLANNTPDIAEVTTGPTCIRFNDGRGQMILFRLNGTTIDPATGGTCAVPTTVSELAENVVNFTLRCFDSANSPLFPCSGNEALIRRVSIFLTLNESGESFDFDSEITFRNLMGFERT